MGAQNPEKVVFWALESFLGSGFGNIEIIEYFSKYWQLSKTNKHNHCIMPIIVLHSDLDLIFCGQNPSFFII